MDQSRQIQSLVDRETRAWDTKDVDLLLSLFHPDMVWPWPPTVADHDPATWILVLGRFDEVRWRAFYEDFFREHELIHNHRVTRKIELSNEGDAAIAVVDIDTLWRRSDGEESHWLGRVSKTYTKVGEDWLLIMHTGVLDYGVPGMGA